MSLANNQVAVKGNFIGKAVWIGVPYEFRYRFSQPMVRTPSSTGGVQAVTSGRLQLKTVTVHFDKTGFFEAQVTPKFRDTRTFLYTGRRLDVSDSKVGAVSLAEGDFRFPTVSKNDQVTIDLVNSTFLPCFFSGATWEGVLYERATRT